MFTTMTALNRLLLVAIASGAAVDCALIINESFDCVKLACNSSLQPTNFTFWRWSTTGSRQATLHVTNATSGRSGNEVEFGVSYCDPPNPNPNHLGCYRSEFAVLREYEDDIIDWVPGVGSSERWFGFSNKLPTNFSFDNVDPQNGPSFQIHAGGGEVEYKSQHPPLNLQVDSTGCAAGNMSCPRWTVSIQSEPNTNYPTVFQLGAITAGKWDDWVIQAKFSNNASLGYLQVWRNTQIVVPMTKLATAYNDTANVYFKFGVYRGDWKSLSAKPPTSRWAGIAYGAMKVGDENSSFDQVSTAQRRR